MMSDYQPTYYSGVNRTLTDDEITTLFGGGDE